MQHLVIGLHAASVTRLGDPTALVHNERTGQSRQSVRENLTLMTGVPQASGWGVQQVLRFLVSDKPLGGFANQRQNACYRSPGRRNALPTGVGPHGSDDLNAEIALALHYQVGIDIACIQKVFARLQVFLRERVMNGGGKFTIGDPSGGRFHMGDEMDLFIPRRVSVR